MIDVPIMCVGHIDLQYNPDYKDKTKYHDYHSVSLYKNEEIRQQAKRVVDTIYPPTEFDTTIVNARLHVMEPNVHLKEHVDSMPSNMDNFHVLHYVIKTNPHAVLTFNKHDKHLRQNYIYELNNTFPHSGRNEGDEERLHLFIELYAFKREL